MFDVKSHLLSSDGYFARRPRRGEDLKKRRERGKVQRPHHSSDRSMDRLQGLRQALFAILTTEPCASLPKVRFNACPAQASDLGLKSVPRNC